MSILERHYIKKFVILSEAKNLKDILHLLRSMHISIIPRSTTKLCDAGISLQELIVRLPRVLRTLAMTNIGIVILCEAQSQRDPSLSSFVQNDKECIIEINILDLRSGPSCTGTCTLIAGMQVRPRSKQQTKMLISIECVLTYVRLPWTLRVLAMTDKNKFATWLMKKNKITNWLMQTYHTKTAGSFKSQPMKTYGLFLYLKLVFACAFTAGFYNRARNGDS